MGLLGILSTMVPCEASGKLLNLPELIVFFSYLTGIFGGSNEINNMCPAQNPVYQLSSHVYQLPLGHKEHHLPMGRTMIRFSTLSGICGPEGAGL